MNITLYSTGCPKCNVLKKKLKEKNISYNEITNEEEILAHGIEVVPVLSVDGNYMNFKEAVEWINTDYNQDGGCDQCKLN